MAAPPLQPAAWGMHGTGSHGMPAPSPRYKQLPQRPAGSQPSPHSTKGHSGLHPRQVPELSPKQKRCPQHCRALHPAKENPRPQLCQDTTVHCPVVAMISRRPSPLPFLQIFLGFSKTQLSVLVLLIYFLSIAEPPF